MLGRNKRFLKNKARENEKHLTTFISVICPHRQGPSLYGAGRRSRGLLPGKIVSESGQCRTQCFPEHDSLMGKGKPLGKRFVFCSAL